MCHLLHSFFLNVGSGNQTNLYTCKESTLPVDPSPSSLNDHCLCFRFHFYVSIKCVPVYGVEHVSAVPEEGIRALRAGLRGS